MRAGLIDPGDKKLTASFPSSGLGYIASVLRNNGIDVHILDVAVSNNKEVDYFLYQGFHLVGISATSATYDRALMIAKKVKEKNPVTKIVLGGPHVGIALKEVLEKSSVIDYAIYGEGEYSLLELARTLETGNHSTDQLANIRGLIYRNHEASIVINEPAELIQNLDSLPFPAWDLFPMKRYDQHVLLTSRGCPFNCSFCAISKLWGRHWRARSVDSIVNEITWVVSTFGKRQFYIADDNFTLDINRIESFCDKVLPLKIRWFCQGVRADRVTEVMLKKMRDAGCTGIALGVESANPVVLRNINKGESVEDIKKAVTMIKDVGINLHGLFMIGNIGDTFETVKESVDFAVNQDFTTFDFYLALPYPRTELWNYVEKCGRWINREYTEFNHFSDRPVFETPEFSVDERIKAYQMALQASKEAKKKYYSKMLKRALRGDFGMITKYRIRQLFNFLVGV